MNPRFLTDQAELAATCMEQRRPKSPSVAKDMMTAGVVVLLAEDDEAMRGMLAGMLRKRQYRVTEIADGDQLLGHIQGLERHGPAHRVALIISDHRMPGRTGLQVLAHMRRVGLHIPVILITAFGDQVVHTEARRLGAAAVLDKPFDLDEFLKAVRRLAPLPADPSGVPA